MSTETASAITPGDAAEPADPIVTAREQLEAAAKLAPGTWQEQDLENGWQLAVLVSKAGRRYARLRAFPGPYDETSRAVRLEAEQLARRLGLDGWIQHEGTTRLWFQVGYEAPR